MEVKVHYSKTQMEATINFIAEHNTSFLGRHDYIRKSIENHIHELAVRFPHMHGVGTMGYFITVSHGHEEGIDNDDNMILLRFEVDPAVGDNDQYKDEDGVEFTVNTDEDYVAPEIIP
jgi:hypothetical protein